MKCKFIIKFFSITVITYDLDNYEFIDLYMIYY